MSPHGATDPAWPPLGFPSPPEHGVDTELHTGDDWKAICFCGWETWGHPTRVAARQSLNDHIANELLGGNDETETETE